MAKTVLQTILSKLQVNLFSATSSTIIICQGKKEAIVLSHCATVS